MKYLLSMLLLVSTAVFAQEDPNGKVDTSPDSIVHKSGFVFKDGTKVKLGLGSLPDGNFKYIRANNGGGMISIGGSGSSILTSRYSGLNGEVSKVQRRGSRKLGYVDYAILKLGLPERYEVDINSAIAVGEIVLPEQYTTKAAKPSSGAPVSLADELAKLKKLLDDGILTKEEFDAQKKKLLEKKDN
jgi:hypothetical protein